MDLNTNKKEVEFQHNQNELYQENLLTVLNDRQTPLSIDKEIENQLTQQNEQILEQNEQVTTPISKNEQSKLLYLQPIDNLKRPLNIQNQKGSQINPNHNNENEDQNSVNQSDKNKQSEYNQEQKLENVQQNDTNSQLIQDNQNTGQIILQNNQSRSISESGKQSSQQSVNSIISSSSSSEESVQSSENSLDSEDDSIKIIEEKIDQIQMNVKMSSNSLNTQKGSSQSIQQKQQVKPCIENLPIDKKYTKVANQESNKISLDERKKRLSIFGSQQKISLHQKQSVASCYNERNLSINSLQHKLSLLSPLRKSKQRKQSIEYNLSLMPTQEQQKYVTREKSEQQIDALSHKHSLIQSDEKIDLLLGIRRRALIKTRENNDRFFIQMKIQQELNSNVYQLENPTMNHLGVQKFIKDSMRKTNKTPKEKNLIKKVIEKLGVFETQKDIIFKNQNTNDTLFDNLNLEQFEKHQCIFHIGGVHLLLPQMDQKEANDNSLYINYMNQIQQGYLNKSNDDSENFRIFSLYNSSFFSRCFIKNKNKQQIKQWVRDIGSDEKKITLLFGGLDYEKRLLINAAFLEGKEYVNIFYPNMILYKTFKPGECFGEIALLTKQRRTATMVCSEKTYCLTLSKQGFDKIVGAYQNSMVQAQLNFLQQFSFIEKIPKSKLLSITHDMKKNQYSKGQIIYKEGDSSDSFYFIIDGEFEISKKENIHQEKRTNQPQNNCNISLPMKKDNAEIFQLNWSQKIKQQKIDIKRIPIVILQANQYFGQYEIFQNQQTRQTKAICTSLKGTLYQIQKSILLYHLNTWNGLDEMKQANQIINNWSSTRITQIKHLNQLAENSYNDLFGYQNVKKRKKQKLNKSESQNLLSKKQSDPFATKNLDTSFNNSYFKSAMQSPLNSSKQFQISNFSQSKQLQNTFYKNESSSQSVHLNLNDQKEQSNEVQEKQIDQEKKFSPNYQNDRKQIQPRFSIAQSNNNISGIQKVVLQSNQMQNQQQKEQNSFEDYENNNVDLMESSMNSKYFQKFKRFHEKKLNEKVHQLLEQEKKSDKRKSDYLLNILDQQQFKSIKSKSNLNSLERERRESATLNEEINNFKEQNTHSFQKLNKKQSIFFNNTMQISQFNSSFENNNNTKLDIIEENNLTQQNNSQQIYKITSPPKSINRQIINSEYITYTSPKNSEERSQLNHLAESTNDFHNRNSIQGFQNQIYFSPNKFKNHQIQDFTYDNLRIVQKNEEQYGANQQNLKNILNMPRAQNQQQLLQKEGQNDSQRLANNKLRYPQEQSSTKKGLSSQQFKRNVDSFNEVKNQINFSQKAGTQNLSQSQQFYKNSQEQSQLTFSQQQNLSKEQDKYYHHKMSKTYQQGINCDLKIEEKELNRIKQQQFLEKINNRIFQTKANEQSINSDNKKLEQLDYEAEQIKELIESSPAKICANINNVLSFKKKFLKILNSQPEILQQRLFDFKQEKDQYLIQKQNQMKNKYMSSNQHNQNYKNHNKDLSQSQLSQGNQSSLDQNQKFQQEEIHSNYSTQQDSIKENSTFYEKNDQKSQNKNKKTYKPKNPIDSILLFIKQQKEINSEKSSSLERCRQDSNFSYMNQTSYESKNNFFYSPKINFSDQSSFKQENNNQSTKIIDILDKNITNDVKLFKDLSIKPEAGFVKKLSILTSKQYSNQSLIQKNFQNQASDQKQKANSFRSQQFSVTNSQIKSKVYQNFDLKNFQTERLSKNTQENHLNLKTSPSQEKSLHHLTSINFSVNQETGKSDDSNYVISSTLQQRKPTSQRIKEKQKQQKGNTFSIQNNCNSIQTQKSKDSTNFQEDISFKQQTTKSSQNFFSIQNFYSDRSPKSGDQVYLFQKVGPSKRMKKNHFLNS